MSGERRDELIEVWREAVASLSGERLVAKALRALEPPLPDGAVTLALGKAAASMLAGAAEALGPLLGVAVLGAPEEVPPGIEAHVGDHPIPGAASQRGGQALLDAVRALRPADTLLVLLSGGGSALAEVPAPGLTLEEIATTTQAVMASGASIHELNAVRRKLSSLKGGGLLRACPAARVEVLLLSDVAGDDPAVIASGPFWPDAPDPRVRTTLLAGPTDLREAAFHLLEGRGWRPVRWPGVIAGEVDDLARRYLRWLGGAQGPKVALVGVGEPVLRLPPAPGHGGRAQHLALRMALGLDGTHAAFLAAGSDGRDGPTEHAGACVDGATAAAAQALGVDMAAALQAADSATAAERLGLVLPRVQTGTNLTDLHLLVRP